MCMCIWKYDRVYFISMMILTFLIFISVYRYKDSFNTFTRMTSLLNAAGAHDDFSFFDILGDNFYDQV